MVLPWFNNTRSSNTNWRFARASTRRSMSRPLHVLLDDRVLVEIGDDERRRRAERTSRSLHGTPLAHGARVAIRNNGAMGLSSGRRIDVEATVKQRC